MSVGNTKIGEATPIHSQGTSRTNLYLDKNYVSEVQEVFSLFDKDMDGKISLTELGAVLRSVGFNPEEAEVTMYTERLRTDDGLVTFLDFVTLLPEVARSGETYAELLEAFRIFDKEYKGTITTESLKLHLSNAGEVISEDDMLAMLSFATSLPDSLGRVLGNEINYKDFILAVLSEERSQFWTETFRPECLDRYR